MLAPRLPTVIRCRETAACLEPRCPSARRCRDWLIEIRRLGQCRTHPCRLDVFGKTEAAGQRGVGEEGDLVDLAAAQGEHHHAPGLRAQVAAEGRLAVGAGRAYL